MSFKNYCNTPVQGTQFPNRLPMENGSKGVMVAVRSEFSMIDLFTLLFSPETLKYPRLLVKTEPIHKEYCNESTKN